MVFKKPSIGYIGNSFCFLFSKFFFENIKKKQFFFFCIFEKKKHVRLVEIKIKIVEGHFFFFWKPSGWKSPMMRATRN